MGRPLNMGGVFRKVDPDLDDDERDEDVDEVTDLESKIKYGVKKFFSQIIRAMT